MNQAEREETVVLIGIEQGGLQAPVALIASSGIREMADKEALVTRHSSCQSIALATEPR